MGDRPVLSVVIPCTRPSAVLLCLEGLAQQGDRRPLEVFIVGEVPETLPRFDFRVHAIPCAATHPNVRRNIGIAHSTAPLIAFLDDDTVPAPTWLAAALRGGRAGDVVRTGPERPFRRSPTARLAHAVLSGPAGEPSSAHHHWRQRSVPWYRVAFFNCVVPRTLFAQVGLPNEDLPWDMDDFEFFDRVARHARFEVDRELAVAHDRYPDRTLALLRYIARLRVRTGEKLVSHPRLYARIPAVLGAATVPWLAPSTFMIGAAAYGAWLSAHSVHGLRTVGVRQLPAFLGLTLAIHATTIGAVQWGIGRGAVNALFQRATEPNASDDGARSAPGSARTPLNQA